MAIPTYYITCITMAYKTACPSCSAEVWYFSCSCESKIFFNELGYPWEHPICRKYILQEQIRLIKDIERLSAIEVYDIISGIEKKYSRELNEETEEMLSEILGKRKFSLSISTYEPDNDVEFSG